MTDEQETFLFQRRFEMLCTGWEGPMSEVSTCIRIAGCDFRGTVVGLITRSDVRLTIRMALSWRRFTRVMCRSKPLSNSLRRSDKGARDVLLHEKG